jgi:hypothetical protein
MSHPFPFHVDAFGCALQVSSSCAQGQEVLERYVFPALRRNGGVTDAPDLSIGIDPAGEGFLLNAGGATLASGACAADLVPELIRLVDEAVLRNLRGLYAVHAGVVQVGDEAVVLPGMTHAGKSSLVAALLERGATYFSDEYALIDAQGRVHPYPRPLLVRSGTSEQVPKVAEEYGARTGAAAVRLGWILALAYDPEQDSRLEPVPQSAGVLLMLGNTPHVLAEKPEMIEAFQNAAAGARCYQGYRGDASEAAEKILHLMQANSGN